MTQQQEVQAAPDFDSAVKIAGVVNLTGTLVLVAAVVLAGIALALGSGLVMTLALLVAGVIGGVSLLGLAVIVEMVTRTARENVKP